MAISKNYKPTVSALILNDKNEVLLTHNKSHGPDFWKLPQGGVEPGESLEEAIKREMKEELGSTSFTTLKQCDIEYKYNWPKEVQEKKGFVGPKITFFILRSDDPSSLKPNLEINELDGIKWIELDALQSHFSTLPEFASTLEKLITETKSVVSI